MQGLIGAARYEEDRLTFLAPGQEGGAVEDLSRMPAVGIYGQFYPFGRTTLVGFEGGLLYGWRARESTVLIGQNRTAVRIDTSLWLLDLSAGASVSRLVGSRWRFTLAGGPLMLFGEYEEDDAVAEDPSSGEAVAFTGRDESEFGVGGYLRAGIEFQYAPTAFIGMGVRTLATDLEFANAAEPSGLNGVQGFVTFTRYFGVR